jgi:pilus assembly protein Flp/PilA
MLPSRNRANHSSMRMASPIGEDSVTRILRALWQNNAGATAIEYGLIAALIAVAAVTVIGTVGSHLSTTFNTVATKL